MARWFFLVISIAWYGSMNSFTTEELNPGFMSTTPRNNYFHYFSGTNKLEKISPTAGGNVTSPFATNNRSFTYDKNGNLATDALRGTNLFYDRANLPYRVTGNNNTYAFGYNTADARIFKGNDNQAYYYLAGSVYDMKNDQWEHYPGGLAAYKNNSLNLVIKDHLTNIRAVISSDNSACSSTTYEAQYDYYPYGKVLRKYENPRSRFQSTDHETDLETGYNNRNARWYDDESFQFLGCDPMQSTYPSWSPYHYVGRNPISILDPTGMNWYQSNSDDYIQYIWFDGEGEREGYKNLGNEAKISEKENGRRFMAHLKSDGTAQYLVPMNTNETDIIGPGKSGVTPTGSFITARGLNKAETQKQNLNACLNETFVNRMYSSGGLGEPPVSLFDMMMIGRSIYNLGSAIYSASLNNTSTSLGAARSGVKQWLQNVGNLERGQLIQDIETVGFKRMSPSNSPVSVFERGGMRIRIDPPQTGTPFNHMHLEYGGNSYNIFLNPVNYRSSAAHIPIK